MNANEIQNNHIPLRQPNRPPTFNRRTPFMPAVCKYWNSCGCRNPRCRFLHQTKNSAQELILHRLGQIIAVQNEMQIQQNQIANDVALLKRHQNVMPKPIPSEFKENEYPPSLKHIEAMVFSLTKTQKKTNSFSDEIISDLIAQRNSFNKKNATDLRKLKNFISNEINALKNKFEKTSKRKDGNDESEFKKSSNDDILFASKSPLLSDLTAMEERMKLSFSSEFSAMQKHLKTELSNVNDKLNFQEKILKISFAKIKKDMAQLVDDFGDDAHYAFENEMNENEESFPRAGHSATTIYSAADMKKLMQHKPKK